MMTGYDSYSVGCFSFDGRELGREFNAYADAKRYFGHAISSGRIASVILCGCTNDGGCNELHTWNA